MKRSTTLFLPFLLALASCGTPAQYSQQRFPDSIYTKPGEEPEVVRLYTEEDFENMAAANIARKQYVATAQIAGQYKLLVHNYGLDHAAKALSTPVDITLHADGTISGARTGSWSVREGTSFVTINIGKEYQGVMIEQTLEPRDEKAVCFTALDSSTGVTIWGYKAAE